MFAYTDLHYQTLLTYNISLAISKSDLTMTLLKHQNKHLISLSHSLKPVIMIGQNGVTDNILKELETALHFHELVKIKISGESKASCASKIEQLINASSAETVQQIGKTLTLFRRNNKNPKIEFPKK